MANTKGAIPSHRPGLLVKYSQAVEPRGKSRSARPFKGTVLPAGWYIWCQGVGYSGKPRWESVNELRFERQIDAELAAAAMREAGLDSMAKMKVAGAETVLRTAFEALQW